MQIVMLRIIGGLLVVLMMALGGAYIYVDQLIAAGIEWGGTYALGVETKVGGVRPRLVGGRIGLSDLTVANPPGFDAPQFFRLGAIDVAVSPASLTEDVVRVPLIALDHIEMNIEKTVKSANYDVILANLGKLGSGAETQETGGASKQFIVERLRVRDVNANLILDVIGNKSRVSVNVPEISLDNIGTASGGVDTAELAAIFTRVLLEAVMKADGVPSAILSDLRGGLGSLAALDIELTGGVTSAVERYGKGDPIGAAAEIAGSVDDEGVKQVGKVLEGVSGLFGKGKND